MQTNLTTQNRAFLYGDAVFETVKIIDGKILFLEDHYFRLMSAMRVMRMEIPMDFTLEKFQEILLTEAQRNNHIKSARARITVYRKDGGLYLPIDNNVDFVVDVKPLEILNYKYENIPCEVDVYKDFFIAKQLLSTLKTTNRNINVLASIYAKENDLQNCILLNTEKQVVESINGNIFLVTGNTVITPPISDGALNGIMRKQIIAILKTIENIEFKEASVSPFDLQKADELFYTNVVSGVVSITKYRKKEFTTMFASMLVEKLNSFCGIY